MGRQLRANLPLHGRKLTPNWNHLEKFREMDQEFKKKQKQQYDSRHNAKTVPQIPVGTEVWTTTEGRRISGEVVGHTEQPRSYRVQTPNGVLRRNRYHLNPVPDATDNEPLAQEPNNQATYNNQSTPRIIMTRTRTGTVIRPPNRLTGLRKGDVA